VADRRVIAGISARRAPVLPALLLAAVLVAPGRAAHGQRLEPKRAPAAAGSSCPRFPTPVTPTPQQRAESRQLAQRGNEAALVGDHTEARNLLRRAAELDLTAENVAYRLGREHEEVGAASDAIREYCRFLSLAPQAPDARDVRERIGRLSPQQSLSASDVSAAQFAAGVGHYERGRLADALTAFGAVIADNPDAAPAYFNRGLVYAAQGRPTAAITDLRRYLALQPRAPDRAAVDAQLRVLRRQELSPASALGWGALLPGGGQFYTRRPVLGGIVAAVAAGGAFYAAQPRDRDSTFLQPPPFPGGEPYPDSVTVRTYPNVGVGLGVAAGALAAGALEAYLYARSGRKGMPRPPGSSTAGRTGLDVRRAQWGGPLLMPTRAGTVVGARLSF
jgi:tetratricopeptide (TPR) repeat protein